MFERFESETMKNYALWIDAEHALQAHKQL